jgi:CO dehydrogenase maturation factor
MGELRTSRPDTFTILDMEASIEHLTRGTVRNVDALLVVTEPYYRSLETTGRLVPLARELGLPQVWVVANKVRTGRDEAALREYCARRGFEVVAVVPFDEHVTEADRLGQALVDYAPAAPAVVALDELTHMFAAQPGVKAS